MENYSFILDRGKRNKDDIWDGKIYLENLDCPPWVILGLKYTSVATLYEIITCAFIVIHKHTAYNCTLTHTKNKTDFLEHNQLNVKQL